MVVLVLVRTDTLEDKAYLWIELVFKGSYFCIYVETGKGPLHF